MRLCIFRRNREFQCVSSNVLANGDTKGAAGMSRSVPSSPGDRKQGSIPIVGSAESLVGRVSIITAFSIYFLAIRPQFHSNFIFSF